LNNSYLFPLPQDYFVPWFKHEPKSSGWLAIMSCGAGFYSDGWGPLPFIFCRVPPGQYLVYRVR
jgi:hypothetical protein